MQKECKAVGAWVILILQKRIMSSSHHCLKPPQHNRCLNLKLFEAVSGQAADSEKVTHITMGIHSHSDEGEKSAALQLYPLPAFSGLLLRNPRRAQDPYMHAQKEIRFRGIE
jgi:hypothetical protein